ncbi:MAG: type I restriction endonuclease subunit R [Dolichospermum sp. BR01]|nr:type I restriction endonuclease subunit R [Dolichospermum sp. BR01]
MSTSKAQKENLRLDEKNHVEEPLLNQLEKLGWTVIRLEMHTQTPSQSYRNNFGEVILLPQLQQALQKINPFLRDEQINEVVQKITTFPKSTLIENNQYILNLLLENTSVSINHNTQEQSPTVRYIDFNPETFLQNNSFIAISQFKVRIPGTENHIIPDITLFINGLPVVVIECKSPKVKDAIPEAIDQLMRYSQQRGETSEGNQQLFYYNQFIITTCRQEAKFGTITTHIEKRFYRWIDPYPFKLSDIQTNIGTSPNDQQRLVAGMCYPENILSIIQIFTIFSTNDKGETIKIVARYQQYRAVKLAVERLITGKNRKQRSGIIWHTQGSGKSLTMLFMVREMRKHTQLSNWKIVFITDRTQLQDQLQSTSQNIGQNIKLAEWIKPKSDNPNQSLHELLANDTPDIVMAMMQKFQENDLEAIFPKLNESPNILLMIDEAHRSQYTQLGTNLDRALPHATRIAYTGTPIDKTEATFGDYIDKYTMKESIADGTTLEIVYEGRTHNAEISDKAGMDAKFSDVFSEYKLSERLQILGYGTRDAYLEAMPVIEAKANDIINHYIEYVFSGGFKAQVVATSREAACRYKQCLDVAIQAKITELKLKNPLNINIDRLRELETAVVISGNNNDPPHLKAYTNSNYHNPSIQRFKLSFDATETAGNTAINGKVGIIIVNNMLLVGFDAPIEQVLYLDRVISGHNLLQAIARVNRVGEEHKDKGFVVDYVGVGHHLTKALENYQEKEQQEIINQIRDEQQEINDLILAHREIWKLLQQYNLTDFTDADAFYDLFYDEDIRFAYILAFKKLTTALNIVMPRKEALDYWQDYKNFLTINNLAYKHFRDAHFSLKGIPEKLRNIADEFLKSHSIDQKIAPISILDDNFETLTNSHTRTKTKAASVEHAIRSYINSNLNEDPELFLSFAEKLEQILTEFQDNWERIYAEIEKLRQEIKSKEKENTYGLDRKKQMPIFRIFKAQLFDNRELNQDEITQDVTLTLHTFNVIKQEVQTAGFWGSIPAQNRLKEELQKLFLSAEFVSYPNIFKERKEIILRLLEWSRENHSKIIGE